MQAQIPDRLKQLGAIALLTLSAGLGACATQKQVALVEDPTAKKGDSAMPWNRQEKWEVSGQFANMTDRR